MDLFTTPTDLDWPSRDFAFPKKMMNIEGALKECKDPETYQKGLRGLLPFQITTKGI